MFLQRRLYTVWRYEKDRRDRDTKVEVTREGWFLFGFIPLMIKDLSIKGNWS